MVIATESVVPVRAEASEASEMLTQLLFNEICEDLERLPRWVKIRSTQDGQEGWVDFKMVEPLTDEQADDLLRAPYAVVTMPFAMATEATNKPLCLNLCAGTRIYYPDCDIVYHGMHYRIDKDYIATTPLAFTVENIRSHASQFLTIPYLWGGKNTYGMDCSGLTQVFYAAFGVNLLRNAREQVTQGESVASLDQAEVGDLFFFDHADRDPKATNISHVGLYLGDNTVIHASGCVHTATVTEQGIFNQQGEQTHHLVAIRRYGGSIENNYN